MNYAEHKKYPNHDSVDCPCVVRVEEAIVNKYVLYWIEDGIPCKEAIPDILGELHRDHQDELSLTSLIDALSDISALAVNFDGYEIAEGLKPLVNDMQLIALNALNGEEWVSPDWIKLDDAERVRIP